MKSFRRQFAACGLLSLSLLGVSSCAQVIIQQDGSGNTVSVGVEPLFGGKSSFLPATKVQSNSIAQMEVAVLQRINNERKKKGLGPLKSNEKLSKIARDYSRRMNKEKFFSHYDAKKKSVADRVGAAGIKYRMVGENLFKSVNAPDVIDASVRGWMNSKGHRANILRKEYTETGVGLWQDGRTYHATQIFLRPR